MSPNKYNEDETNIGSDNEEENSSNFTNMIKKELNKPKFKLSV